MQEVPFSLSLSLGELTSLSLTLGVLDNQYHEAGH